MAPAGEVVASLRARGETLAVAESLTGGALAAEIVSIAGASQVFRGGLVLYATDLKTALGGVPAGLLAERGPVDGDVAAAMADGARRRCGATWGLAITGAAGPEPHGGQPAGTVWLGLAAPNGATAATLRLSGGRERVRSGAVRAALELLADALTGGGQV